MRKSFPVNSSMNFWRPMHNALDRIILGCIKESSPSNLVVNARTTLESAHGLDNVVLTPANFYCDL